MKNIRHIVSLAVMILGVSASAELIASESFSTGNGGDYTDGKTFGDAVNKSNRTGTAGFGIEKGWDPTTTAVLPRGSTGLTHGLLQGTATTGLVQIRPVPDSGRSVRRPLAAIPSGATFFMSGLVSMNGMENLENGGSVCMGMGGNTANNIFDSSTGVYFGLTKESTGEAYLAVFVAGRPYKLGEKLTYATAAGIQMVVLKIDYNTGLDGSDSLSVWVAQEGEAKLTPVLNISGVEAGKASNLVRFIIQCQGGAKGSSSSGVYLDEFRFGKTLQDVTSISAL